MLSNGFVGYRRCWSNNICGFKSYIQSHKKEKEQHTSYSSTKTHNSRLFRFRPRLRVVTTPITTTTMCSASSPSVMVNSCTGKMGCAVAEAVLRSGLKLVPLTITGESKEQMSTTNYMNLGNDKTRVEFVPLEERDNCLHQLKTQYKDLIVVDFTLPVCVNDNGILYGNHGLNFVMGTTGGDREKLIQDVEKSEVYAVIAPQMGKQIVAFQAMLKYMSENFPGAFSGYKLSVKESHQSSKVDTSGTAKAVIRSFTDLGAIFDSDIKMVRDPEVSMKDMGVPEDALLGHAYHTYHLSSPDHTVDFEFQHNVAGRTIYAEGTVDAILFLFRKLKEQSSKKIFNMIDVLEAGSMR